MNRICRFGEDAGNILIMSVVLVALLVATAMSYLKWSANERWDSAYEEATIQAYFLAQAGLIEQGLEYLRTRKPTDLPRGSVMLPPKVIPGVGKYFNTTIRRVGELSQGSVFQRTDTYDLFSTGRATFNDQQLGLRHLGRKARVERIATMRARLRSFANYMYLTNFEATGFNEIIWFWTRDTLWGRTHSNDYIGLQDSPCFYGPISTSKDEFIYDRRGNIHFEYPPVFNAPPVYFPRTAETLRKNALHISSLDGRLLTRISFQGGAGIDVRQFVLGDLPEEVSYQHLAMIEWGAIFVDGQAEIEGEVAGRVTVGSAGDMWLIDNIYYSGADSNNGFFVESAMTNLLGLVSEKNIFIRDNPVNGKRDGWNHERGNQNSHSIVIDAGMVALDESFTFEHQNDEWEPYQGPSPDDRGIIHLKGSVTQWRRGYVHRSNHISTGYGKDYHYDFRFDQRPPPYYLEALDENGNGLFDIVSWGELEPRHN